MSDLVRWDGALHGPVYQFGTSVINEGPVTPACPRWSVGWPVGH